MQETKGESEQIRAAERIIVECIEIWHAKHRSQALAKISQTISPPLRNITGFDLEATGLRTLPSSNVLGALPCLRVLNLQNNKLKSLNGGLLQCRCLEELNLDNNHLKSIQGELKNLHCLRKSKSNSTTRICERYRRSQLRKVYVTQQIQTDDTDSNVNTTDNMIMESRK
ncbi:unnamed protein product [Hymenolepis diminuta]|uniref:Uncharacterized protein n=1 Tax=Hymenolepis diminuta TaxID=6216 RepID=A0A564YER1_HYMDI|nr:unnamed protein product [Hymenolepis diminuta]